MGKQVIIVIVAIVAIAFLGYRIISQQQRAKSRKEFQREYYDVKQASQEIYCDSCGEITTGLNLSRNEAARYQVCPKCGQKTGRPIVYRFCQREGCNRQLIKYANDVWDEGQRLPGQTPVCPNCGRADAVIPDYLDLKYAEKIAKETGQQFP